MAKLTLNSIPASAFRVSAENVADGTRRRADIVSAGRVLAFSHAAKAKNLMNDAMRQPREEYKTLTSGQYAEMNEKFQADHLLYAAERVCAITGQVPPANMQELRANGMIYARNEMFYRVLQGIWQEVAAPILPAVLSSAVGVFAEMVEVGFGETYALTVESNDIPVFQDSSWGASRSVPKNRFYSKTYTLNPQPRTAAITAKWSQLVGTGTDFGQFFANLTAGMYAKICGMWSAALTAAASNTALVPSALSYVFNSTNWATAANKVAALNNVPHGNLIAYGSTVALAKVLPNTVTGSSNVNMDAAIATLLGAEYNRSGYLGEFMGVRLMPVTDAIVPGTQNTTVGTILSTSNVWMMASAGRKPMTIGTIAGTPLTIEIDPMQSADFEIGVNVTYPIDVVSVFSSRVAKLTV